MSEKVFGLVYTEYPEHSNHYVMNVQEATAGEILADMRKPSPEFLAWLKESSPGEYWNQDGRLLFRTR